jgi:hypothetical protein
MDRTGRTVRSQYSAKNLVLRVCQCLNNAKKKSYSSNFYQLQFIHPAVNSHSEKKIYRPSLITQICIVNCTVNRFIGNI